MTKQDGRSAQGSGDKLRASQVIETAATEFERRVRRQVRHLEKLIPPPDPERLENNRKLLAAAFDVVESRFTERVKELLATRPAGIPADDESSPPSRATTAPEVTDQVARDLRDLNACFDELLQQLRAKDQQLQRFAEGYDAQVFKRFLYPFVVLADALDGLIHNDMDKQQALERVRVLLVEQALDDCGVEPFSPAPGSLFREVEGVDDAITLVPTSNAGMDGCIESTVRPGYRLRPSQDGGTSHVLLKAKVRVFSARLGAPS